MFGYQGQIRACDQPNGYFRADNQIMNLVAAACNQFYSGHLSRLGIEAPQGTWIRINNELIRIGKTGLYEVNDAYITSLQFEQNSDPNAYIDFIL